MDAKAILEAIERDLATLDHLASEADEETERGKAERKLGAEMFSRGQRSAFQFSAALLENLRSLVKAEVKTEMAAAAVAVPVTQ
jgi:hypothetical protein